DARFAEFFQRFGVDRIVDPVIAPQLRGELPDYRLVVLHVVGLSSGADGSNDGGIKTRLERQWRVRVPLILRAPGLRGHDDRHLVDALVERSVEPDIFADFLQTI